MKGFDEGDTVLIGDMFAGAGGTAAGAMRAVARLGLTARLACVNHWQTALDTHEKNHPTAEHFCADVWDFDPLTAVPGGELDLLMASPTCTFFSQARGGKPVSWDQRYGRMTPLQVLHWLKVLDVKSVLIENVPEFLRWGPLSRATMKPNKKRAGHHFKNFLRTLRELGYVYEYRILNAADYGDATTRHRFFLIAFKGELGQKVRWPFRSHDQFGRFGLPRWRSAAEILDGTLEGESIYDRDRPLSPLTLARIHAGAVRFGWPSECVEEIREFVLERFAEDLARLRAKGTKKALLKAVRFEEAREEFKKRAGAQGGLSLARLVARTGMHKSNALCVRETTDPLATVTTETGGGFAVLEPRARASGALSRKGGDHVQGELFQEPDPFVTVLRRHADGRSLDAPLPTVCAGGTHLGLSSVVENEATGCRGEVPAGARGGAPEDDRDMKPENAIVFQVNQGAGRERNIRTVGEPVPTIVTRPSFGLAGAFVLNRHGENGGVRAHATTEPLPTATCRGAGYLAGTRPAFVLSQASGGAPRATDEPVPTIPTDGAHALVTSYYGNGGSRPVTEPVPTVTTKDRFGLVMPVTHQDASARARGLGDPVPTITGAPRGELAFISAAFGERKGQRARVRSLEEPVPTICAKGRIPVVHAKKARKFDVLFRMLACHELAAAMSFTGEEQRYEFTGTKTEITRQIGNSVPVRTAAALVGAILEVLVAARRVAA